MPNYFALNQALQTTAPALFKLVENSQENKILQQGKQKVFEMSQQIDDAILNAPDDASKQSLQQYKYSFDMSPEVNAFKNFEKGNFEQFGKKLKMFQLLPDYKTIIDKTKGAEYKYTSIGEPLIGSSIPESQRPSDYDPAQMYQKVKLQNGATTWELVGSKTGAEDQLAWARYYDTKLNDAWSRAKDKIGLDIKTIETLGLDPTLTTNLITATNSESRLNALKMIIDESSKLTGKKLSDSRNAVRKIYKEWYAQLATEPKLQEKVKKIMEASTGFSDLSSENTPPTETNSNLKVGDIEDGYKYLGGNPKDESSWEKVGG